MNIKTLTGLILILGAVPFLLIGMKDRDAEQFNTWIIRQSQIAKSQGGSYPYTLRPVLIGSGAFIITGGFLLGGIISIYQGQLIEEHKKRM